MKYPPEYNNKTFLEFCRDVMLTYRKYGIYDCTIPYTEWAGKEGFDLSFCISELEKHVRVYGIITKKEELWIDIDSVNDELVNRYRKEIKEAKQKGLSQCSVDYSDLVKSEFFDLGYCHHTILDGNVNITQVNYSNNKVVLMWKNQ